ncbi:MAG: DUF4395 family protein [Actinobacteria bacterium]|uniref:Unannotated protein n=1 Tax=freshwater metagenome TaxID=449393 RepID=A0A6J7NQN8_9ZZZZ|nr:DUF4395 family protein [Actinomycetota bacterium]
MSTTATTSSNASAAPSSDSPSGIDPRGPRLGAGITVVVLAGALVAGPGPIGTTLLLWQALVFALGAFVGLGAQPYGVLYRRLVRPRLGPPAELEGEAPPRFAQLVGFGFAIVGLAAYLLGATLVGQVAVGAALAAAFLNVAFAFCLGCEMYLIGRRVLHRAR